MFVSALGSATGATASEIRECEIKIKEEKEKCEKQEKETRGEQVNCESELKIIDLLLKWTHRMLEKDHKEFRGKIDLLNEKIKKVAQVFQVEKSMFIETIGNQREYIERLEAGKLSKQRSSNFIPL